MYRGIKEDFSHRQDQTLFTNDVYSKQKSKLPYCILQDHLQCGKCSHTGDYTSRFL